MVVKVTARGEETKEQIRSRGLTPGKMQSIITKRTGSSKVQTTASGKKIYEEKTVFNKATGQHEKVVTTYNYPTPNEIKAAVDKEKIRNAQRESFLKSPQGSRFNVMLEKAAVKKLLQERSAPYSANYYRNLEQYNSQLKNALKKSSNKNLLGLRDAIKLSNVPRYYTGTSSGTVMIGGSPVTATNHRHYVFLQALKKTCDRDERFKNSLDQAIKSARYNIIKGDSTFRKAARGFGQLGISMLFLPMFISNLGDKIYITGRGLLTPESRKDVLDEMRRARRGTAKAIGESYNPMNPENWAGILFTIGGINAVARGFRTVMAKSGRLYLPSVRNAQALKNALIIRAKQVLRARGLARKSIKAKSNVRANQNLLKKLNVLEKNIDLSLRSVNKIINNPKVLKLIDMNPLAKTSNLLKEINRIKHVFHATATTPSKLFGNVVTSLKDTKQVLRAVNKASGQVKRGVSATNKVEKALLDYAFKNKGVIGGGKAQNVFVKNILRRSTSDYDILHRNPSDFAKGLLSYLKKSFPNSKFSIKTFKSKGSNVLVRRIKYNNKDFVDVDKLTKDLRVVKTSNSYVLSSKNLALNKLDSVKNPLKAYRYAKDSKDLRLLTGKLFSDKGFINKIKNPKNYFTVTSQPQGMGASRLKFGETFMYFDFEVPTGYAYNALVKGRVFPKWSIKLLKSLDFKKAFIKRLDSLRYINANQRFMVIKLKTRISDFPAGLKRLVVKASKGRLSGGESVRLRKALVDYINKNPNKTFIDSRTGSQFVGERQVVDSVMTTFKKFKKYYSIDPETKLFFDVVEVNYKKGSKGLKAYIKSYINDIKRYISVENLKQRYGRGDLLKRREFARLLRKVDRATKRAKYLSGDTYFKRLLKTFKKLLTDKKGLKRGVIRRKKRGKVNSRRKSSFKVKPRKRIMPKTRGRTRVRVRPRTRVRVRPRIRPLIRTRNPIRPRPRVRVRPRTRVRVRPRTRVRVRPRTRVRVRPRTPIRLTPRTYQTLKNRIPPKIIIKKKNINSEDKKKLIKLYRKTKPVYRPSFAAVIFNITSYKIPTSITGFEIRPIIITR